MRGKGKRWREKARLWREGRGVEYFTWTHEACPGMFLTRKVCEGPAVPSMLMLRRFVHVHTGIQKPRGLKKHPEVYSVLGQDKLMCQDVFAPPQLQDEMRTFSSTNQLEL